MITQTVQNQIIDIRAASGGAEYTWALTITETTGKNIAAATVRLSLGAPTAAGAPGTWRAPDVDTPQANVATRVVQLFVGAAFRPAAGTYGLWSQVGDTPETVPRFQGVVTILADPTP